MIEQLSIFDVEPEIPVSDNLTTRQKETYRLIYKNMLEGRTTSQRELYLNYSEYNHDDGYVWTDNPRIHNHCSSVCADINTINADWDTEKIIIWDNDYNYRLAQTSKEVKDFCDNLYWIRAKTKLWKYGNLMRKMSRDGQAFLFETKEDARTYWQSFFDTHLEDLINESVEEITNEESNT